MKIIDHHGRGAILLGRGTVIERGAIVTEELERAGGYVRIKVALPLTLTFTGRFCVYHEKCSVCGAQATPPDADAAMFVLAFNDGDRLLFPHAQDCDEDRDRYPMRGWRNDADVGLICPECAAALDGAAAEVRKRRARKP